MTLYAALKTILTVQQYAYIFCPLVAIHRNFSFHWRSYPSGAAPESQASRFPFLSPTLTLMPQALPLFPFLSSIKTDPLGVLTSPANCCLFISAIIPVAPLPLSFPFIFCYTLCHQTQGRLWTTRVLTSNPRSFSSLGT